MNVSMRGEACTMCLFEFEPGTTIVQLGCHVKHILHEECINEWIAHNERTNKEPLCPTCRSPIQKDKMIKKKIVAPVEEPKADPFNGLAVSKSAIEKQNQVEQVVVVRPPEGSAPLEPVEQPQQNIEMTTIN